MLLAYLGSTITLLTIYTRVQSLRFGPRAASGTYRALSLWRSVTYWAADLRAFWRFEAREPPVVFAYASQAMLVITGVSVFVFFVPLVQMDATLGGLGLGTRGVGWLAAIGSVGLVLSSMGYGFFGHRIRKHLVVLASFLVLGLTVMVLASVRSFAFAVPLAVLAGAAIAPLYIGIDTLLHESVTEAVRGRVFSNREWTLNAFAIVVAAVASLLSSAFPARHMLPVAGLLVSAVSMAGFVLCRGRRIG